MCTCVVSGGSVGVCWYVYSVSVYVVRFTV